MSLPDSAMALEFTSAQKRIKVSHGINPARHSYVKTA